MTDFVIFTKDLSVDISSHRSYYHDFGGKGVRIQVYWTPAILASFQDFSNSLFLIKQADAILRKYTLSLDAKPQLAPSDVQQKIRSSLERNLQASRVLQSLRSFAPEMVRNAAASVLEQTLLDAVDLEFAKSKGVVNFNQAIHVPYQARPDKEQFVKLRAALGPIAEENRMVVVFTPISGMGGGYTVLEHDWLPWVVLDPKSLFSQSLLLHEMGHASRLAHQKPDNVMSDYGSDNRRHMWNWQADTIFDSYWCNGPKFRGSWGAPRVQVPDSPFLWDEPS